MDHRAGGGDGGGSFALNGKPWPPLPGHICRPVKTGGQTIDLPAYESASWPVELKA